MTERVQTKLKLQVVQKREDNKIMNIQLVIHWLKTENFYNTCNWLVTSYPLSSKMVFLERYRGKGVGKEQEAGMPVLASNRLV